MKKKKCHWPSKVEKTTNYQLPTSFFLFMTLFFVILSFVIVIHSCRYDGSIGSASRAMFAVDQFVWQLNRRNL